MYIINCVQAADWLKLKLSVQNEVGKLQDDRYQRFNQFYLIEPPRAIDTQLQNEAFSQELRSTSN